MSYILEAIKKADRKRKIGEVPDLHTNHNLVGEESGKRASWPYFVALLLFFNAGGLFWWLEPWKEAAITDSKVESSAQEEKSVQTDFSLAGMGDKESTAPGTPVEFGEVTVPEKMEMGGADQLKSAGEVSESTKDKAVSLLPLTAADIVEQENKPSDQSPDIEQNIQGSNTEIEMAPEGMDAADVIKGEGALSSESQDNIPEDIFLEEEDDFGDQSADISETEMPDETEVSDNGTETEIKFEIFDISTVPFIYQLPASIQQRLPEISISFHSYTHRPATRMVRINGRILREGQDVTEDIRLEKIVPTGVVLLLEKRRFRVDV